MYLIIEIIPRIPNVIGIKEGLAEYCERWGDIRVVEAVEDLAEQTTIESRPPMDKIGRAAEES